MASIMDTLFGVSTERFQQERDAAADAQALAFARLDPFEQANYAIGRGAYGLAGAIGGALGGQDPELQRITMRQQIASQIDFTDPASIQQGMNALGDDIMGKQQLAQILRQQQESGALIGQRNASALASVAQATRERAPPAAPTTNDLTNARAIAALAGPEGSPEYNAAFNAEYTRLTAPKEARGLSFGAEAERVAAELFDNKTFADLTPTQKAVVNKRLETEGRARTPTQTFVLPGDKALSDIPAFRASVQRTIEPQIKAITAADQATQAIDDSLATGNFASFRAAQVQFARAIAGAGDLSQKELKAAGADPSLLGGAADILSSAFSSTPTADTQKKIRSTLAAIRTVASKQAQQEVDQQRKIALRSPGYNAEAVSEALMFPQLQTRSTAGGGTLAEQAAAELKRRQSKGK